MPLTGRVLRQLGFVSPESLLAWAEAGEFTITPFFESAFAKCADPMAASLAQVRLEATKDPIVAKVLADPLWYTRFIRLAGASDALADMLIANPSWLACLAQTTLSLGDHDSTPDTSEKWAQTAKEGLLNKVTKALNPQLGGADIAGATTVLRETYFQLLIEIAAADLMANDQLQAVETVSSLLAALADFAIAGALLIAGAEEPTLAIGNNPGQPLKVAVIALGKCGGQELNYISDVDVVFVARWDEAQLTATQALATAERVAVAVSTVISGPGLARPLWPLDTALRPEGQAGSLVRSLESYRQYYQRWAQSWEFQALLKARYCAGDEELGTQFVAMAQELVWQAANRPEFVDSARAMRTRVEANIASKQRARHLKLGPGGLRDIEFTVQLLQLVHGRVDEGVRSPHTLTGIQQLSSGGYIGREDGEVFGRAYRLLRLIEHRAQLAKLQRTHVIPTQNRALQRLARSTLIATQQAGPAIETFETLWQETGKQVRKLHERLFYRPLLGATARLSEDELALTSSAAQDRLAAIGFSDPKRALQQLEVLTAGATRRATILRQILPALLGVLANGADPDAGLLGFRILAEEVGNTQWFVRLLRDSKQAATRLCQILPNSVFVTDALVASPTLIKWLDADDELVAPDKHELEAQQLAVLSRQEDSESAINRVQAARRRELTRAGLSDLIFGINTEKNAKIISQANDLAVQGALRIAQYEITGHIGEGAPKQCIVAMGRFGGNECGYASDADVMFIHESAELTEDAIGIVNRLSQILQSGTWRWSVDTSLRPEGKNGPLSRSFESFETYLAKWSEPWERQALLRARVVAGDPDLAEQVTQEITQFCYSRGLSAQELAQIRLLKARMEKERLPRGVDKQKHVKLGPGGLADVEWAAQLTQLTYGHEFPQLRTTSTRQALRAAESLGILSSEQVSALLASWDFAARIRAANTLVSGRLSGPKLDLLPQDHRALIPLARILGYQSGAERTLVEDYLRTARHAREVFDEIFWPRTVDEL
ncbi:bifunctional glutamine-synthetase adenylyltransferase/deadenyltransferase [Boudabousia tangfeifanii]|uniref:Bifunctional glutamine-synthetase adenylyltransferase/deadenyltransferase n=2 Tax=Boudabousia tangfeifanii TaxID=1912795 RepID=A0A1D9MKF9_9ACTO|nr:bifunctional glutamine-synthetase adenylyltransferase/deadenyltransferase [Boudabousia tangfeifanii]